MKIATIIFSLICLNYLLSCNSSIEKETNLETFSRLLSESGIVINDLSEIYSDEDITRINSFSIIEMKMYIATLSQDPEAILSLKLKPIIERVIDSLNNHLNTETVEEAELFARFVKMDSIKQNFGIVEYSTHLADFLGDYPKYFLQDDIVKLRVLTDMK